MELYEELIHTQPKIKSQNLEPVKKIKKIKSKEEIKEKYLEVEMSQTAPSFSQIQGLSKTSYRIRDVFELSDDDDDDKFSHAKNNETIILDDSDAEGVNNNGKKNDLEDLNFILNSFQEIKIEEKNDESKIEEISINKSYLPLSQRIQKKFGISTETIFKK